MEHENNYVKTIADLKLTSAQTPTGCSFARHLLGNMDDNGSTLTHLLIKNGHCHKGFYSSFVLIDARVDTREIFLGPLTWSACCGTGGKFLRRLRTFVPIDHTKNVTVFVGKIMN